MVIAESRQRKNRLMMLSNLLKACHNRYRFLSRWLLALLGFIGQGAEIGFEGDGTFWCYGEGNEAGEDRLPADLLKMLKTLFSIIMSTRD